MTTKASKHNLTWHELASVRQRRLADHSTAHRWLRRHRLADNDAVATLEHPVKCSGKLLILQEKVAGLVVRDLNRIGGSTHRPELMKVLARMEDNVSSMRPDHTLVFRIERLQNINTGFGRAYNILGRGIVELLLHVHQMSRVHDASAISDL